MLFTRTDEEEEEEEEEENVACLHRCSLSRLLLQ